MRALGAKWRSGSGLSLVEALCTTALLVLLCLMPGTGIQAASRACREITAQAETRLLLNTLVNAMAGQLRYALPPASEGEGEPEPETEPEAEPAAEGEADPGDPRDPEDPRGPEDPGDPGDPDDPDDPGDPEDPEDPGDPGDPENPSAPDVSGGCGFTLSAGGQVLLDGRPLLPADRDGRGGAYRGGAYQVRELDVRYDRETACFTLQIGRAHV